MPPLEELWVAIEGFPNYEISNYGRIVNIVRGTELKINPEKRGGRLKVSLSNKGVKESFYVHRLVARAFFVNYSDSLVVGFINGNPADVGVRNLTLEASHRGCWRSVEPQM